jgi:hypothetical protein
MKLTVQATGVRALILLMAVLAALFVLPRALSAPPTAEEAEEAIRAAWGRQEWAEWAPRLEDAPPAEKRALQEQIGRASIAQSQRTITAIAVRRSLVGPPFSYRWAYYVSARVSPGDRVEYYRISRGLATPIEELTWRLRLF